MKFAMIFLIMIPSVCLVVSVALYVSNRTKYYKLISDFQKIHDFPAPYLLHCNMGYLGAPLMTYFFIHLKEKKRIFFLEKNSQAYEFTGTRENSETINRLKPLYYLFSIGFLSCILLALIALCFKLNTLF